jgi:hypothetical protein
MADEGVIYLAVDFTAAPGTQTTATLERGLSATGPWEFIREIPLLAQQGFTYDTTAPLDTSLWYRWTGQPGNQIIIQGAFIEVSSGAVLLKDPLRPWANLSLSFCETPQLALAAMCNPGGPELVWAGFGDQTYRSDANLFDVFNDWVPADIYGIRKRFDGELTLMSKTLAAKEASIALFAGGGPLQIQSPLIYSQPDIIVQPGNLSESYLSQDQRRPYRLWSAPFAVVRRPLGPIQGTVDANWCIVADTFATFADLTASGFTWAQVASGQATSTGPEFDGFGEGPFGDGPFGDGG